MADSRLYVATSESDLACNRLPGAAAGGQCDRGRRGRRVRTRSPRASRPRQDL